MNTPDIYNETSNPTLDFQIAVMQAARDGGRVLGRGKAFSHVYESSHPPLLWDWVIWSYWISPPSKPKKIVPMERDDYPAFFILRCPHSGKHKVPLAIGSAGIEVEMANTIQTICFAAIMNWKWEYSIDRKTWLPCTKEVAE